MSPRIPCPKCTLDFGSQSSFTFHVMGKHTIPDLETSLAETQQALVEREEDWKSAHREVLERESVHVDRIAAYEKMLANYDKLTFLIGNPFIWEGLKLLLEKEPMRFGPAMTRNALETYEEFYKEWVEINTYEWDMAKSSKDTLKEQEDAG